MKGLTSQQASELLKQYGGNVLTSTKKKSFFAKLIDQFKNFLTVLLIIAAFLSFVIGEGVDGGLILAIVILNALFGLYQEAKAEGAIDALKKITVSKVRVFRDGQEIEIESRFLVPGDVVFIEEGIKVAADGQVLEAMNLEVNESVLTGESLPIPKQINDDLFSGTIVSKGRGLLQVSKTGMNTKFGAIAQNLSVIDDSETPMQKKLENLTRVIGFVGIVAAAVVFIISLVSGDGYFPAFLLSISLAVAVVPEGLPAVMTITLSIGVKEMSRRKSVIRRLSAIEALGSVTLIATDKTGTLTTNKMKVKEMYYNGQSVEISSPRGETGLNQLKSVQSQTDFNRKPISTDPFSLLLLNGILCSTASLVYVHDHGSFDVLGDPTEGALLYLAKETGIGIDEQRKNWKIVEELPFDSVTKRMSVIVKRLTSNDKQEGLLFSKGAPESILEISSFLQKGNQQVKLTQEEKKKIEQQMEEWARKGLRVLAFSYKQLKSVEISSPCGEAGLNQLKPVQTDFNGPAESAGPILTDSTFLGMVAIHDAPRPEVREAVERAKRAGIKIIMITGDNEKTAESIGVVAGIITEGAEILTGTQVEEYSDQQLLAVLPKVRIFARTSPFHKHRIVKLYQQLGEVVAVTGDGVNDAIALKQADVGVAMGLVGTDVARETADMVITDDNFSSIVNAVEEGRNIIKNLKNAIVYLLSCNITEALALVGGLALGLSHIFYPIQLLYINLVTDGIPALSLAFSPRDPHLMQENPQKSLSLLSKRSRTHIGMVSVIGTILILSGFFIFRGYFGDISYTAAFTILTLIQSFILVDQWLSHRSLHTNAHLLKKPIFLLAFFFPFITQLFIVTHPVSASWFKISPISIPIYLMLIFISSLSFIGIKLSKKILKYN